MPTTINGVGTHYYGKSNRSSRQGTCHSCGRAVTLESYDTRLWFVVIFIPIIPLGRKRITDKCPTCSRHFVAPLGQWEDERQLTTSGTLAEFTAHPTPENAERHHRGLLQFQQYEEADAFRKEALKHFSESALLHTYFAQGQLQMGKLVEARLLFEKALELNRELTAAREGMALLKIHSGKLEEATQLTEHLRVPGAAQLHDISLLEKLALAWQKNGHHSEALEEFGVLLRELPSLKEHRGFRKMVRVSEKALKRSSDESLLPKISFSPAWLWQQYRTACLVTVLAVFGTVGSLIHNNHLAGHAPLHVVNAYPTEVNLSIDGGTVISLHPGHTKLSIPEGVHKIGVSGAITESIHADIQRGFFERWNSNDVWVLNPGGRAIVMEQVIYYTTGKFEPPESMPAFFTGQRLQRRHNIDYPFVEPPKEQQVPERESYVTRTALRLRPGGVYDVVELLTSNGQVDAALQFCEQGIIDGTASDDLLAAYADIAKDDKTRPRIRRTLQAQLRKRPVQVALHRQWQILESTDDRANSELLAEYEALSKAAPGDAALLYLRARIEPDFARQSDMLKKCTELANAPAWAWYARGMDHAMAGDWKTALPMLEKAAVLEPASSQFLEKLHDAQRSLGIWEPLLKDLQTDARLQPQNFGFHLALVEAHSLKGDEKTASRVAANYKLRIQPLENSSQTVQEFDLLTSELLGQTEPALKLAASAESSAATAELVSSALVTARRWSDLDALIKKQPTGEGVGNDPLFLLAAALGAHLDKQPVFATAWEAQAVEHIKTIDDEKGTITAALKSSTPPAPASLQLTGIQPHRRAVIWAWLAQKHPSLSSAYAALARAFNYRGYFPHRVVKAATAQ
jgi:tetratricopeptide (TPR) repeat protein